MEVKLSVIYTGDNANVYLCMYIRIDNFISQKTHCIVLLSVHHRRFQTVGGEPISLSLSCPTTTPLPTGGLPHSTHVRTY